ADQGTMPRMPGSQRRPGGGRPVGRSSAAPRGAKVKTSGDGSGRSGARVVARARAPRGRGSSGQRRREGGPAGRSGAAPHGAKVKTSGDGGRGPGAAFTGQARTHQGALSPMPGSRRESGGSRGALRTARAPRLHLPASS